MPHNEIYKRERSTFSRERPGAIQYFSLIANPWRAFGLNRAQRREERQRWHEAYAGRAAAAAAALRAAVPAGVWGMRRRALRRELSISSRFKRRLLSCKVLWLVHRTAAQIKALHAVELCTVYSYQVGPCSVPQTQTALKASGGPLGVPERCIPAVTASYHCHTVHTLPHARVCSLVCISRWVRFRILVQHSTHSTECPVALLSAQPWCAALGTRPYSPDRRQAESTSDDRGGQGL